jgi:benzoate/toluate 1,2-dioxygenase beta subunit
MTGSTALAEVSAFLHREARLLDERRFDEWRDLFAEDGVYWVPARPGQTDPFHEVSLFYDDRELMAARFRRFRHPRMHADIPPSRAMRAVSNIEVEGGRADGLVAARSVLTMAEYRAGETRTFMGRVAWHLATQAGGGYRIRLKRVDLLDAEAVHGLMTVPF